MVTVSTLDANWFELMQAPFSVPASCVSDVHNLVQTFDIATCFACIIFLIREVLSSRMSILFWMGLEYFDILLSSG